jgi:hypothetical protein
VVAPGSADWIRSLQAVSNSKPTTPASARPRTLTARSRPTSRPPAASVRLGRVPSIRRGGR